MMSEPQPLQVIFDTSPLITLCSFRLAGTRQLVVDYMVPNVTMILVDTVAKEATANPAHSDAREIHKLLDHQVFRQLAIPTLRLDSIIDSYTKLGQGERDTLKLAAFTSLPLILDDYLAFVVASRFGLKPMLLLDFLVLLVNEGKLTRELAINIVDIISPRYSSPFVNHTRVLLNEAHR